MTRDSFWNLIARSGPRGRDDKHEQSKELQRLLEDLPAKEIIAFHNHLLKVMREAYRADLWDVIYIVDGGCSDDGFDYFRSWLVLQGKETFYCVLANPRLIANYARRGFALTDQSLGSAVLRAYEAKAGSIGIPYDGPRGPGKLKGKLLDDEGRRKKYPVLWKRFIEDD
jgi:hypothetical protein